MKEILDTVRVVAETAKHVRINSDAIKTFASSIDANDLNGSEFDEDTVIQDTTEEQRVAHVFVYDAVNFCYWGTPKWTISINSKDFDGSAGMLRALRRAVDEGCDILSANYLADISKADLQHILRGNIEIPMFAERLQLLRELGQCVKHDFHGSFSSIVKQAHYDAAELVRCVVKSFPTVFDDHAQYRGQRVNFYKRAQLIPTHLSDLNRLGYLSLPLSNCDELTAFADYKVPQLMRQFGILEYSEVLAQTIDTQSIIEPSSEEEVEIRAATIWANELITREVKKRIPTANAIKIDGVLWFKGQVKSATDKPYHRTRTTWY